MTQQTSRHALADGLKAVAAHGIVLHHFAAYGPLADCAALLAPLTLGALYDYARMLVQVFLVVGGYLAARGLSALSLGAYGPHGLGSALGVAVFNRYLRLVLPFMFAVVLAMLCSVPARLWLVDAWVPDAPTWGQVWAHAGLLHGLLGSPSLTAGAWYIAVDFQLFALLALLVWLGKGGTLLTHVLVALLCASSLAWFNRDSAWDLWALYFFGAYGLGALAWWVQQGRHSRSGAWALVLFAVALLLGIGALVVDFRLRVVLAMGTAVALVYGGRIERCFPPVLAHDLHWLGQRSYALFLVHFCVVLLLNTLWLAMAWENPVWALCLIAIGWATSVGAAAAFYRGIELPLARWRWGRSA
jgi:peptidoglycan/LPS O-acetylase OafA/YrhL